MEIPELLTVREVATLLKLSPAAITRRFESYPGVIDLGSKETRFKRTYKVLRVPRPVLERLPGYRPAKTAQHGNDLGLSMS